MRIEDLPSASSVADADVLAVDTSTGTFKVPRSVLAPAPLVIEIPYGQWYGSDNDYYYEINASNVTVDSILVPTYDNDSKDYFGGPVWCIPSTGSFTIHTSAFPTGTVKIMVQFPGIIGEANYQVLSDVYSKSQTYSKNEAVAKADIVNSLASTATNKPLSANMGKALNEAITQSTAVNPLTLTRTENPYVNGTSFNRLYAFKSGAVCRLVVNLAVTTGTDQGISDYVEIGRISGWSSQSSAYATISPQTGTNKVMLLNVSTSGVISIMGLNGLAATFYRANVVAF